MGASSWSYWVPYQADITQALSDLRIQVFESGNYYASEYQRNRDVREVLAENGLEGEDLEGALADIGGDPMKELLTRQGFDGTHSILDVSTIADTPKPEDEWMNPESMGKVFPMSESALMGMFGTTQPTRELIAAQETALTNECARYEGRYIVAFADSKPTEILFVGVSGD